MPRLFRLFLLILIFAGLNAAQTFAAATDDAVQSSTHQSVAISFDQPCDAAVFSPSNMILSVPLPGIVCNFSNATFSGNLAKKSAVKEQPGFTRTMMKEVLTICDGSVAISACPPDYDLIC